MAGKPTPAGQNTGGASAPKGGAPTGGFLKRGSSAIQKAKQEASASRKGSNDPWRFWLPNDSSPDPKFNGEQGKNERGIIILDESIEDAVGFHEHNLKINGKYGNYELCPKEWEHCPLCEGGDKSYYIVMLSVFVLSPWVSKDKKKSGDGTKVLLAIKSTQLGKFEEVANIAQKQNGTLRGTYLHMKRDTSNSQSPSIGEPSILDNGSLFDNYTEEELVSTYGHGAVKTKEGKIVKEENEDIKPFNYSKLFIKPSAADLASRFGGMMQPGSDQEADEEWGTAEQQAPPTPAKRTAPKRSAPASSAEEDMQDEGEQGSDPFAGQED